MNLYRTILLATILSLNILTSSDTSAQNRAIKVVAELPSSNNGEKNHGLAGAFIGEINNKIVIVGGSNFSKGFPWQGGAKQFKDEIYVVTKTKDSYDIELIEGLKFPDGGIAHGVSCVVNNRLYCFGGTRANSLSEQYYIIEEKNNKLEIEQIGALPDNFLPVAASNQAEVIYIHGTKEDQNALYSYNTVTNRWSERAQLPAARRNSGAVFTPYKNRGETLHFLIGGRDTDGDNLTLFSDMWQYNASSDSWRDRGDITIDNQPQIRVYSSVSHNKKGDILLIGGDNGEKFSRLYNLEREIIRASSQSQIDSLKKIQISLQTTHKGFSSNILLYSPKKSSWKEHSTYCAPLPVVTTAAKLKGKIVVPSGEITPGVRSNCLYEIEPNL